VVELFAQFLAQAVHVEAHLHHQRLDRAALLFEQRLHQVRRLDGRMIVANGQRLGVGQRQL